VTDTPAPKPSDLKVRVLSAIVMLIVAGGALWLGGGWFLAFVAAIGLGVIWEFWGLVQKIALSYPVRLLWMIVGCGYVSMAGGRLLSLRQVSIGAAVFPIILVAGIDIGAYFSGRTIGGPKIAPSISPSKTWAGLAGGIGAASIVFAVEDQLSRPDPNVPFPPVLNADWYIALPVLFILATFIAVVAQTGDFFESWMKRRAGVKDSGSLIPGHGGLFDRVDGLLAVLCTVAVVDWITR
jgi:phosphatidate cytidylyltransferase